MSTDNAAKMQEASYTTTQLGVWTVLRSKSTPGSWSSHYGNTWHLLRRFLTDAYTVSPSLCVLVVFLAFWQVVETIMLFHFSGLLLSQIEAFVKDNNASRENILRAAVVHFICMASNSVTDWWRQRTHARFQNMMKRDFEDRLLEARLNVDVSASIAAGDPHRTAEQAWSVFARFTELASQICLICAHLKVVYSLSSSDCGGSLFALLCLVEPVLALAFKKSLFPNAWVCHASNTSYLRMRGLQRLSSSEFSDDVLTGDLAAHIVSEHRAARKVLGNASDAYAEDLYRLNDTPIPSIVHSFANALPMLYYAGRAFCDPSQLSVASIAIMQQTSTSMRQSFSLMMGNMSQFSSNISQLQALYRVIDLAATRETGVDISTEKATSGTSLDLRNVSYSYPGDDSTLALDDISVTIKKGSLVLLVGENGSGKSSLLKVLNGVNTPMAGTVAVDGVDRKSYKPSALRRVTAHLAQDHRLFPLSVADNIGFGRPEHSKDMKLIRKAAEAAGALSCIERLPQGFSTNLKPESTKMMAVSGRGEDDFALAQEFDNIERQSDISGGELQRLVAARMFMRLGSEDIKLATFDEPTSAMDPIGAKRLLTRLRDAQAGRTMVFVTHHYAHLAEFADLIICMKDGKIAEQGTHSDLMKLSGEYAAMWNASSTQGSVEPTSAIATSTSTSTTISVLPPSSTTVSSASPSPAPVATFPPPTTSSTDSCRHH